MQDTKTLRDRVKVSIKLSFVLMTLPFLHMPQAKR
jgi:hypothetical protein